MLEIGKINLTISSILDDLINRKRVDLSFKDKFYASYNQPTLQIGVVGKMKTGKSTLVNALIFGGEVLPASTEPVTVTLTKVTYGEKNRISLTFISEEDIRELEDKASYQGESQLELSIKANASEILQGLPSDYRDFLGKTIENISENDLKRYVSATGEYSGMVKSVTIEMNNEDLKGITIIDTPGFNDPVSSRGETTKQFLSDCHVVLFVHNNDGYDMTDGELLTTQIEYAGVSKLIEVFNRMDMKRSLPLSEWENKVSEFIEDREDYLSKERNPYVYNLVRASEALPTSAFMAICGQTTKERRDNFIKRAISTFEERYPELTEDSSITVEEALVRCSNINGIIKILNAISKDGEKYLVEKPIQTLIGKLRSIVEEIESEIAVVESDISLLKQDRKSAIADLDGIIDFLNSVKDAVSASPLEVKLLDKVSDSRQSIQNQREQEAKSISKEVYKEPGFGDRGVTKGNIGQYNVFLSRFQSILRNEISNLSRALESTSNGYIRETLLSLVNPKISEARRENFEKKAKSQVKTKLQGIVIAVDAYTLNSLPSGKAEQWSLLHTNFVTHYNDAELDKLFVDFKDVSHTIGVPSFILNLLLCMEEELRNELSKSPAEIKAQISEKEEELSRLQDELQWVKEQQVKLSNI